LEPLLRLHERLERGGVTCALGGSGLLHALGLIRAVRDWDLTTDDDPERVRAAFGNLDHSWKGSDELHADQKFQFDGGSIELIVGFAFHVRQKIVKIPTIVSGHWRGIPLGSPESWWVAYHLMKRPAKARLLLERLKIQGVDPIALDQLTAQPLPRDLSATLSALPRRELPTA
jgi:hypothetical protein